MVFPRVLALTWSWSEENWLRSLSSAESVETLLLTLTLNFCFNSAVILFVYVLSMDFSDSHSFSANWFSPSRNSLLHFRKSSMMSELRTFLCSSRPWMNEVMYWLLSSMTWVLNCFIHVFLGSFLVWSAYLLWSFFQSSSTWLNLLKIFNFHSWTYISKI